MILDRRIRAIFFSAATAALPPCAAIAQALPSGAGSTTAPSLMATPADPAACLQDPDPNIPQNSRDLAAVRLVSGQNAAVHGIVLNSLSTGTPAAKLAVARALGSGAWPDPLFIDPLLGMLRGRDEASVAAAAQALAQYKDNTDVLQQLIVQATSERAPDVRQPVIRALGSFNQKLAAQTLLDLQQRDDNDQIQAAAGDALVEMTGLADLDHDSEHWAQWWGQIQGLSDADFQAAVARSRAEAFSGQVAQHKTLEAAADELLRNNFWHAPVGERGTILLSYLQSPAPEIRSLGADLVYLSATTNGAPPETIQETRLLLADPSSEVRAAAATALSADFDSAADLVAQLGRERDDVVRIRLMNSLAPFHDIHAIEQMVKLVGSGPADSVRIAAANGIRQGGDTIDHDPALKARATETLKVALKDTDIPGKERLREAIVGALAAMRDISMSDTFRQLLAPTESLGVRANALIGLGNLPDSSSYAAEIARNLDDEAYQMRLAAIRALSLAPNPMPITFVNKLLDLMSGDGNDQVRVEAWNVLQSWVKSPGMDESNLAALADGLKARDPVKELFVRQRLVDRLAQDSKNAANESDRRRAAQDCASQEQTVGDMLMSANPKINRPADAAEQYRAAFDYWKANNGTVGAINPLCGDVVRSLLAARRWDDAANFAAGIIKDFGSDPNLKVTSQTVSLEFIYKAGGLLESDHPGAYDDAMALFDAAGRMNPPLPAAYAEQLMDKRTALQGKHEASSKPSP